MSEDTIRQDDGMINVSDFNFADLRTRSTSGSISSQSPQIAKFDV